MSSFTLHQVRAGAYFDSVVLMQLQKSLTELSGVLDAGVVMATAANRDVLLAAGFDLTGVEAKADDLLIMIAGESESDAQAALEQVDSLLVRRRSTTATTDFRPRSMTSAINSLPGAEWVLISVPGRYAAPVAEEALSLGKNVFLYSDNVSLEDEIRLKRKAAENRLLLMGPDCGTAIINGVGLGFANRVRRGSIGVVGASGTGLQAITSMVHNLGFGVSQAIGTGGRDLKDDVGGITAAQGLATLAADPQTEVIVFVSKPPSSAVASRLLRLAQATGKPTVVNFIGYPVPAPQIGHIYFAATLTMAAQTAAQLLQAPKSPAAVVPRAGFLRALFSGGTLAYEALLGCQPFLTPLLSNIPIHAEQELTDVMRSQAHTILDLGEDIFTQGRLHPMMDNDLRLRRLAQEAADPEVGLILLDVVLGEGAHGDPVSEIAPAVRAAKAGRDLDIVAIVIGTADDPQDIEAQIEDLRAAGAIVYRDVTAAVAFIVQRLQGTVNLPPSASFSLKSAAANPPLAAINVGLESFYDSVRLQGGAAVHVDWRPPAGGNAKLMAILAKMKKK